MDTFFSIFNIKLLFFDVFSVMLFYKAILKDFFLEKTASKIKLFLLKYIHINPIPWIIIDTIKVQSS